MSLVGRTFLLNLVGFVIFRGSKNLCEEQRMSLDLDRIVTKNHQI